MKIVCKKRSILVVPSILMLIISLFAFSCEVVYAKSRVVGSHLSNKAVDSSTANDYLNIFGSDADGGRYAGRVWTDKSVYSTKLKNVDHINGANVELDSSLNEEFLVSFSALGSSRSVKSVDTIPIDLILVLDTSTSMSLESMNALVVQTNSLIERLMSINKSNRIGIVSFAGGTDVLLELDHYTKVGSEPYISMERFTGDGTTKYFNRLNAKALNSKGKTIDKKGTYFFADSTYLQGGIYEGMKMLADEEDTTYLPVDNKLVNRVPVMIVMSDGGTNVSSATATDSFTSKSYPWWEAYTGVLDTVTTGKKTYTDYIPKPNDNPIYSSLSATNNYKEAIAGRTLTTLMTSSYMKKAVEKNYGRSMFNYSIAYNTDNISNIQEIEQLYGTLNPKEYFISNSVSKNGTSFEQLRKAYQTWNEYLAGGEPTLRFRLQNFNSATNQWEDAKWMSKVLQTTWKFQHVTSQNGGKYYTSDFSNLEDLYYVDDFYEASSTNVGEIFAKIVNKIESASFPPIIDSVGTIRNFGIVYEDPLGEYMEVKDVKMLTLFGKKYVPNGKVVNGNTTTYTFASTNILHPAYAGQTRVDLSQVGVEVSKKGSKETLTIIIPKEALPLRSDMITLDADKHILGYEMNKNEDAALPIRIFYSVGISDDIKIDTDSDGRVDMIDTSKFSKEYVKKHTNADGTISLYSNLYSGNKESQLNNVTIGDATATFKPSSQNRYYYFQRNRIIYANDKGKEGVTPNNLETPGANYQPVRNISDLKDNKNYYLVIDFYRQTTNGKGEYVNYIVERSGAELKNSVTYYNPTTDAVAEKAGNGYVVATKVGGVRLGRLHRFALDKTLQNNLTNTASYSYVPTYLDSSSSSQTFRVYLGNNGRFHIDGGNLKIINKMILEEEEDKEWDFEIIFKDKDGNLVSGEYFYTGTKTGTIQSGDVISLKSKDEITIYNLPSGVYYEVKMVSDDDNDTIIKKGNIGSIKTGVEAVAVFQNYEESVMPVEPPDTDFSQNSSNDNGSNIRVPNTFDSSRPLLWFILSIGSLLGIQTTYQVYKKVKESSM